MPNPDTISGLSAWWRADSLVLANGAAVASWPDSSAGGFTATQATAGLRPTFATNVVNGKPVVRFPSSGARYLVAGASSSLSAETLFVVIDHGGRAIEPVRATSGDGGIIYQVRSGTPAWSAQNTGLRRDAASAVSATGFNILTATHTTAATAFYANGTAAGTGSGLTPTAGRTTVIGADPAEAAEYVGGDIAEIISYNRVLTAGERATVHSYLSDKYGITVSDYVTSTQTVTSAGIASGEAFGSGTVTASPVPVAGAGIASAEAFGAGQVAMVVTSPGIASAEAHGSSSVFSSGVVASAGIPSAEVFGSGSLTAGPVTVSSGGIASAEAVSAGSRIVLVVASPGISSAEAFGSSMLTVGPVAVSPLGIASAEAFGAGVVAAGPVALVSAGIPSAEVFGTHRVNVSVFSPGIPSAQAFGIGTLLPGPISIFSVGIPSGEAFGLATIVVTLDSAVRKLRPITRIVPLYEVLAVRRVPRETGPPDFFIADRIPWSRVRWGTVLSKGQQSSVTCSIASLTEPVKQILRHPDRNPAEVHVLRNGKTVCAGPLLAGSKRGGELTLEAAGLMAYLRWMIVLADKRFDQADQFAIAAWLIDQWQASDSGHFGIDTSAVGTSGRLRDISYDRNEIHQVSRRLEELGARLDGFDAEIDPATRRLQLAYPSKGIDRSSGEDAVVFGGRAVDGLDGAFSLTPDDFASDAFGSGSAAGGESTLWSEQANLDLRRVFGRTATTGSWSDVSEQGTLDDHVANLRDLRDQPLRRPGRQIRVTPDTDLDRYDVGDTVDYEVDTLLGIGGPFRLRSRFVDVMKNSPEAVDLEFV